MILLKRLLKYFLLLLLIIFFYIFCSYSNDIADSVKQAISVCANVLIPSLFPCIVISNILIRTDLISVLPGRIQFFSLFVISLISGYPVGSILLNECILKNKIQSKTATKLLPCFINAGPTFVISVVGISVLQNKECGVVIFAAQCIASLILFVFCGGFSVKLNSGYNTVNFLKEIINAFSASLTSLKTICLYVLIFFPFNKAISIMLGSYSKVITSITEITSAVLTQRNIYIIVALLSFGGICIYMQINSIVSFKFSIIYVLLMRILHGLISVLLTKILLNSFKIELTVFSSIKSEIIYKIPNNFAYCTVIFLTIICLIISINRKSSGKLLKDLL